MIQPFDPFELQTPTGLAQAATSESPWSCLDHLLKVQKHAATLMTRSVLTRGQCWTFDDFFALDATWVDVDEALREAVYPMLAWPPFSDWSYIPPMEVADRLAFILHAHTCELFGLEGRAGFQCIRYLVVTAPDDILALVGSTGNRYIKDPLERLFLVYEK